MEISFSLYFVTLLVVLYTRIINGSSDCNCHEEEWVDPDLLNRVIYDHASKTLKERPRNPPRATEVCVTNEEKASIEDELKLCKQSLNDCSKLSNDSKNGPSSKPSSKQKGPEQHECLQNKVYMKRFINILLRVSKLNEDMPQNLDIHLHITVTPKQLEILQKFSKGSNDVSLPQLDHVLSSALMSSSSNIFLEEYIPWSVVTDYIQSREMLMAVVLGCLPMFFIWKVMNGHSFKRIMMMFLASSFIISFSVTYCRIYKLAEIKQYAMMKKNPDIPVECHPPSEPSWMDLFKPKSTLQSEVCREYYEAVMLDPFLEVTPAVVLSEMTAGFFLHPSGMLGSAIANFSKGILENLPFGTNWLVLIGSSFLIIVIIFATCGGVIKLPFYMGGLVLSGQRPQERITAGQQIKQPVEQVQPSSVPVPGDETMSSLMQTAASIDKELVIMNVHGFQRLLSGGNTAAVHRDTVEEMEVLLPKKKDVCYACEQRNQFESQGLANVSDCGKSHYAMGAETVAVKSKHDLPFQKNYIEEQKLKKSPVSCELKDRHIKTERVEVITEHNRENQIKEGAEELSSADGTVSTVGSSEVLASNIEDKANRHRSDSTDFSDEENSFEILSE